MTNKTSLRLDNIRKGIYINKEKEVDFLANIIIQSETTIPYEYVIIESGDEDNSFLPFTLCKGTTAITHKNTDGIHKKMVLLLKSEEPIDVEVKIDVERYYNLHGDGLETLGPRGQVLLNSSDGKAAASTESQENKPVKKIWYKDPWIIGGIVLALILIVIFIMASRKSKSNSGTLFAEM